MAVGVPVRRAGEGPLTYGLIVRDALGMLRVHFLRVATAALLLSVLPAILVAFVGSVDTRLASGTIHPLALLAAGIAAVALRLVGEVGFTGYLDEAVGSAYFRGHDRRLGDVLRTLPWGRLVAADVVVVAGTSIGLALLVVPGLAFYMLFGLVGPVIVQEQRGIRDAFRRTLALSRKALLPIGILVAVPTALEVLVHEIALGAIHDQGPGARILVEWLLATVIRGAVGLLTVALAVELMARTPEAAPGTPA